MNTLTHLIPEVANMQSIGALLVWNVGGIGMLV
jgi:hypothetical protein